MRRGLQTRGTAARGESQLRAAAPTRVAAAPGGSAYDPRRRCGLEWWSARDSCQSRRSRPWKLTYGGEASSMNGADLGSEHHIRHDRSVLPLNRRHLCGDATSPRNSVMRHLPRITERATKWPSSYLPCAPEIGTLKCATTATSQTSDSTPLFDRSHPGKFLGRLTRMQGPNNSINASGRGDRQSPLPPCSSRFGP